MPLAFASSDVTAAVCKVAGERKNAWWCAEHVLVGTGWAVWHAYQIQLQEVVLLIPLQTWGLSRYSIPDPLTGQQVEERERKIFPGEIFAWTVYQRRSWQTNCSNRTLLVSSFFYVSPYQNHRHLHRRSYRLRPCLSVVKLGSHKQASLPSILIVRVDGHRAVNVGGSSHLLPCPRWLSSFLLQFSECSQG